MSKSGMELTFAILIITLIKHTDMNSWWIVFAVLCGIMWTIVQHEAKRYVLIRHSRQLKEWLRRNEGSTPPKMKEDNE